MKATLRKFDGNRNLRRRSVFISFAGDITKAGHIFGIWACTNAAGSTTNEQVADAIWNAASHLQFGASHNGDGWAIIARGGGDCDDLARAMMVGCNILGLPASVQLIRASTNANCLDQEFRGNNEYLILNFGTAGNPNWNNYEGTCYVAGFYYAIEPKIKATSDLDMLRKLGAKGITQYWVRTNGVFPGNAGGEITAVLQGPIAIP